MRRVARATNQRAPRQIKLPAARHKPNDKAQAACMSTDSPGQNAARRKAIRGFDAGSEDQGSTAERGRGRANHRGTARDLRRRLVRGEISRPALAQIRSDDALY